MELKVITFIFASLLCCDATYIGAYTGKYGIGYPGPAAYAVPIAAVKTPIPYTLPAVGYNSIPLSSKSIYSYPWDLEAFYGGRSLGFIDPSYGAASFIEKGLHSGHLRYGYGPSLSGIGRYNQPE